MAKFKIGDRVRVVAHKEELYEGDVYKNNTGTVLEDCETPFVRLDVYSEKRFDADGLCEFGHGYAIAEDDMELLEETKKEIFDIEKYKGNYVMHCETEEQANEFCKYLNSLGKTWSSGKSYLEDNYRRVYKEDTCYFFNEDGHGRRCFATENEYTILKFKDFTFKIKKEESKKMTIKELQQIIIDNFYDEENHAINISNLDFGELDIIIDNMNAKQIFSKGYTADYIEQGEHSAQTIVQSKHKAEAIYQNNHKAKVVYQRNHTSLHEVEVHN